MKYFTHYTIRGFVLLVFISCSASVVKAEDSTYFKRSDHSAFLEMGGNAVMYSFNYEFKLRELRNSTIVQSIGFQIPDMDSRSEYLIGGKVITQRRLSLALFPLRLAWISHKTKKHHLEVGIGVTYYTSNSLISYIDMMGLARIPMTFGNSIYFSPNLGYRYTGNNGFLMRVTLSPLMSRRVIPNITWYGGISFGYNFKKKKK